METNLIDVNTEVTKLNDEKKTLEEDLTVKNYLNEALIDEKNKLEEKVARFNETIQKMFKERNVMKDLIDKKKATVDLTEDTVAEASLNDVAQKLDEKTKQLKTKESLLDQANKDKRRLAKDLADAQQNKNVETDEPGDKCSKLTSLLKDTKNDLKKANEEVKKTTVTNNDMQEKLNKANNTIVSLETKNNRLEKQVENLIDVCGGQKSIDTNKRVTFDATNGNVSADKSKIKCIHHDKARCREGSNCSFMHSNVVCKSYSKTAYCENQNSCVLWEDHLI